VFVRKNARSVPADHYAIRRLAARFAAQPQQGLTDIAVHVEYPEPISRVIRRTGTLNQLLEIERARLLKPLLADRRAKAAAEKRPRGPMSIMEYAALGSSLDDAWKSASTFTRPERRTETAYEEEVESYLHRLEQDWSHVRASAAHTVRPPVFTIVNHGVRNFRQVEVTLHVAGAADAIEYEPDPIETIAEILPEPPRLWGADHTDWARLLAAPQIPLFRHTALAAEPTTSIRRTGSFELTFPPVDVRPGGRHVLDDSICVLIPADRTDTVIATWSATALNVDGKATGEIPLHFDGPDIDPVLVLSRE